MAGRAGSWPRSAGVNAINADERRGRVTRHQRSMNVAGVFDAGALEVKMRGPNQERMQLISPGRPVRADLIVK